MTDAAGETGEAVADDEDDPHLCHWPGCRREVPPVMWGCAPHWRQLPARIRQSILAAYRPGQEIDKTPSRAYIDAAVTAEQWARNTENTARAGRGLPPLDHRTETAHAQPAQLPFV